MQSNCIYYRATSQVAFFGPGIFRELEVPEFKVISLPTLILTWFFIFNNEPYLSSQLPFAFSDNILEIRIHFELYSVILTHFFEKISQFSFILMFAFVKIVTGDVRVTRSICRSKNLHFGFFKESSPNFGYIHLKTPNSFLVCQNKNIQISEFNQFRKICQNNN